MRTMIILKGIPGCGKSTLAATMISHEKGRFIRINRDDLRGMVVGPGNNPHERDSAREDLVRSFKDELVKQAFAAGYDVILDDTHLVPMTVKKLHKLAEEVGDVLVIEKYCDITIEECVKRDASRTGYAHVGEKVIRDMARMAGIDKGHKPKSKETYYPPRNLAFIPAEQDKDLPKAIMCDLDGTLALIDGRSPYDATDCDVKDKPNQPVIDTVLAMYNQGVKIIFMSGRDQKYRPETMRFIEKYCLRPTQTNGSYFEPIQYELHMRGETAPNPDKVDMRKDAIIKQELFDKYIRGKYNVLFVLDDRNQVVDFWRSIGLTCFQVAPGAF